MSDFFFSASTLEICFNISNYQFLTFSSQMSPIEHVNVSLSRHWQTTLHIDNFCTCKKPRLQFDYSLKKILVHFTKY